MQPLQLNEMMEDDDMEQKCEDAVFEICDARERYPKKCADELAQCLRLKTEINMAPIKLNPPEILPSISITEEQKELFDKVMTKAQLRKENSHINENHLELMLKKTKELKIILDQLKKEEDCTIDKVLKKTERNKCENN